MTEIGMAIFVSGLLTYLIRVAPLFLPQRYLSEDKPLTRFLEYTSFALMGGIVSLHVVKSHKATEIGILGINAGFLPACVAVLAVFVITIQVKNMVISLLTGLVVYGGLSWTGL